MVLHHIVIDDVRGLSVRAMIAAAARAARRHVPAYRLPAGHEDARRAPRNLRTALTIAEHFCSGSPWEDDGFARKAARSQVAAEQAACAVRAIPKIVANLPTMSEEDLESSHRRFGDLASMTVDECEAAYAAAQSVVCTIAAVCLVTLSRYDPRDVEGDSYINRIPVQIAKAFACAPPDQREINRLRELSVGQEFPRLGDPIVLSDLEPADGGPTAP